MSNLFEEKMFEYSVIIPFFNNHLTIADALKSLTTQSILPQIVIIIDDCSEIPLTFENIPNCINKDLNLIILTNTKNCGPAFSRNRGLEMVQTNWVFFLDADDLWSSNKIKRLSPHLVNNTLCVAHGTHLLGNPNINTSDKVTVLKGFSLLKFLFSNIGQTSTLGIKGSYRFTNGYYCEDHQLVYRLALFALIFNQEILYFTDALTYIRRAQSTSGGLSGNKLAMRLSLISRLFKDSILFLIFSLSGFLSMPVQIIKHIIKIFLR